MADVMRLFEQAQRQVEARQFAAARQTLTRALAADARSAAANDLMGSVLLELGQARTALYYARKAAELDPTNAGVLADLGGLLSHLGEHTEAVGVIDRALAIAPGFHKAVVAKVAALLSAGRIADARDATLVGLTHHPGDEVLVERLAACEMDLAMPEAALARLSSLRLSGRSTNVKLAEYQATLANYASVRAEGPQVPESRGWVTPLQVLALHKGAGAVLASAPVAGAGPMAARAEAGKVAAVPGFVVGSRALRVAVVSADLRQHSVVRFFEPIARHLDRSRVELVGVMLSPSEDAYTARVKAHCVSWRNMSGAGVGGGGDGGDGRPSQIAAYIRQRKCDLALDLGGLMNIRGLLALRERPAPVQVTYLGYPNTTGCAFMDRRIVDGVTDPEGLAGLSVEKLARTPGCFVCYQPPAELPVLRPRDAGRPVTFGCYSVIQKLSEQTVRLWARVLEAVPGSRLLVKSSTLDDGPTRAAVLAHWASLGLDTARVGVRAFDPSMSGHLDSYHEIDIGLDPTPYNGTTSTCDALSMGTPVLAVPGPLHAARVSASILTHSGLGDLVVPDDDALVARAKQLADDRSALAALHTRVREAFLAGPVCDGPKFCEGFAGVLESIALGR
jgi:hypothetical protein